jgi:ABC-type branched-subunit amino acid transport system substrate-binding protein
MKKKVDSHNGRIPGDATSTQRRGRGNMRMSNRRTGRWAGRIGKTVLGGATLASAIITLGTPSAPAGAATSSAPGVTPTSITVGTISTQTGTLAGNFGSLIYGERAYFKYINAQGGVNGRKINYKYALDDGGSPSQFNQLASTLINQDHVFAVTGVASAFFAPNLFVEAKIPTYGYNVSNNWAGPPNLFAAGGGGSVQYLPGGTPEIAYLINKVHAKSVAIVAYGVAASAAACQADGKGLSAAGIKVSYTDYKIPYPGTTVATDVQRMKQAGADFVLSCMDVQGNVTMARAIKQYGLKATQFWLSGNDQSTLDQNSSLMQGIYFYLAHVPFLASQAKYPGLKLYLATMKKYEPKYVTDEVAIQGWESAALFVQGVRMAGNNLTQANVIKQTNSLTSFNAGGLTTPTNWKDAGHSGHAPPYCASYIQVKGTKYLPALNTSKNSVFVCFASTSGKNPTPIKKLPPGTPNA